MLSCVHYYSVWSVHVFLGSGLVSWRLWVCSPGGRGQASPCYPLRPERFHSLSMLLLLLLCFCNTDCYQTFTCLCSACYSKCILFGFQLMLSLCVCVRHFLSVFLYTVLESYLLRTPFHFTWFPYRLIRALVKEVSFCPLCNSEKTIFYPGNRGKGKVLTALGTKDALYR